MPPTTRFQRLVYRTRAHQKDTFHTRSKTMLKRNRNVNVDNQRKSVRVNVKGISVEDVRGLQPLGAGQVDEVADPKAVGAWRYKGSSVLRANDLDINKYYDHKSASGKAHESLTPEMSEKLPRRRQESNFFITVNPNLGANTTDGVCDRDGLYATLNGVLAYLSSEKVIATYLKYGPKHQEYINDLYSDVVVQRDWIAAAETGPKKARVHAHIWLTLHHYSQIQIDTKMLAHTVRAQYNKASGDRKLKGLPYIHVKLLPQSDWTDVMKGYIHKAMSQPGV
jgi:hypothetical protein